MSMRLDLICISKTNISRSQLPFITDSGRLKDSFSPGQLGRDILWQAVFTGTLVGSGVLAWWQSVEAAWCECRGNIHVSRLRPASLSLRGPSLLTLTLSEGVRFIAWFLRLSFFRGMPTGLKAFLEPPGVCELLSYLQYQQ